MSKQKESILLSDIIQTTKELATHLQERIHRKDFNDRELSFLDQMIDTIVTFRNRPSPMQIQWLYQLYFKHIEDDEDEFEAWQDRHFEEGEKMARNNKKQW